MLAATDIPWRLDAATLSCFERRVYTALPDLSARMKIFETTVGPTNCNLMPADWKESGELTEGYSGSDINAVVKDARMQPLREISSVTHFRKLTVSSSLLPFIPISISAPSTLSHKTQVISDGRDLFTPCSPSDEGTIETTPTYDDSRSFLGRPVRLEDFVKAVQPSRRAVSVEDIVRIEKWTQTA